MFVVGTPHWVPILCSSQTHLQPLPVHTQGTQLLKVFIQLYYNNSHQQYENKVSQSSMFKITVDNAKDIYGYIQSQKTAGAVFTATGSESTEMSCAVAPY